VNAYEQLSEIRMRLEENGANEASIELIDKFIKQAEPTRDSDTNVPMAMMLRHLLRQREVLSNDAIFNDLQELVDDRPRPSEDAEPFAYEEEHRPRPHSYYKQQKAKERQGH
jgi:hypothetical protein